MEIRSGQIVCGGFGGVVYKEDLVHLVQRIKSGCGQLVGGKANEKSLKRKRDILETVVLQEGTIHKIEILETFPMTSLNPFPMPSLNPSSITSLSPGLWYLEQACDIATTSVYPPFIISKQHHHTLVKVPVIPGNHTHQCNICHALSVTSDRFNPVGGKGPVAYQCFENTCKKYVICWACYNSMRPRSDVVPLEKGK